VYEVKQPSWRDELERANSKHPKHVPGLFFDHLRHIIFSFRDTTLEVMARTFELEVHNCTPANLLPQMQAFLTQPSPASDR
jgi:hypothetical protein